MTLVDDNGKGSTCAAGGCPITALIKAVVRFAVRHIPILRKRAEKAALKAADQ